MLRIGKNILFSLLMFTSMAAWSQGQYDVQIVVSSLDCTAMEVCIELQIKATSATTNFNLADQNYRLTFSSNLANPTIDQELTISGFVVTGPFTSLYNPHTLTGSSGNLLSYNVILAGGDGYLLDENTWVSVGSVCFDIIDINGCFSFDWNVPAVDFPPVVIVGKDMGILYGAMPGNFIDDSQSCTGQQCSDPPMADDDNFATPEDMPVSGDASINDIEPDGDTLNYSTAPIVPPVNGTVNIDPDGTFLYTPNLGFTGIDSFSYEVCDTDFPPLCDTATVVIDVYDCSSLPGLTFTADPCNFSVTITADDVGPGAIYTWDFGLGAIPSTATGIGPHIVDYLTSGQQTLNLTVTFNGCNNTATLPVVVTNALTTSPSVIDESCFAADDGSINLNVSGGAGPYTFIWNDGQTTEIATALQAGSYTTIIQDANGCFATQISMVTQPPELFSSAAQTQSILCGGTATGHAFVAGSGGIGTLSYLWDNGEATQTATMLLVGNHTVTVFDATGCEMETTVNITENPPITVVAMETQGVSCFGQNDGSASVTAGGGIPPLTYLWSNGSSATFTNMMTGGTHSVTVTDNIGCSRTADVVISEPSLLTVSAIEDLGVSCNGESDGQATATPAGGILPYTFLWDSGVTNATATNLNAGSHSITITDNNGCAETTFAIISEPSLLTALASESQPVSCNGGTDGQASVATSGGILPLTFLWGNGGTTATASNLDSGSHSVTVTDNNGCMQIASALVTEPSVLSASTTENSPVACPGDNTGVATIIPSGGTAAYTFNWDTGTTLATATNLDQGQHHFTVTDTNGCTITSSVSISELPGMVLMGPVVQNVECGGDNTGIIDLDISGGTAPYSYDWSGSVSGSASTPVGGTSPVGSLPAGNYSFTVTDANNCIETVGGISISEPTPLSVAYNNTMPSSCTLCNASGDVTVAGGTAPYSYLWDNGNTSDTPTDLCPGFNNITVIDQNGCSTTAVFNIPSITDLSINNFTMTPVTCFGGSDGSIVIEVINGIYPYTYQWSNGLPDTDSIITTVSTGMYQVTVTDNLGCPVVENIFVTEPAALTAGITEDIAVDCNGNNNAAATVTAMGGTGPYTYQWDLNTGTQSTEQATSLSAMTYSVTVSDVNNCTTTASIIISEPSVLSASTVTNQNVSCAGFADGNATVSPLGGTPPYTYLWDNSETGATATILNAGFHTITVTDMNTCSVTTSINITEPLPISLSLTVNQDVSCFGGVNGSITATASDGTPGYTFSWDNGETTSTASNFTAGIHFVTVSDNNGCTLTGEAIVGGPPSEISASANADHQISCFGANNGVATVTGMGGSPAYTYAWDNGATDATVSNLSPGIHNITITDSNGCSETTSINIIEPAPFDIMTLVLQDAGCFGEGSGSASVSPMGGTPGYSFIWDNGSTDNTATGLLAGMYSVTVTDTNGCFSTGSVNIAEPNSALSVSLNVIQNVNCFGETNGSAEAIASGGTPVYTYAWDNGETNSNATNLGAGNHSITITDTNGCIATNSIMINEPSALSSQTTLDQTVSCFGGSNGEGSVTANGGTAPYSYLWSTGETTQTATELTAGMNNITVTDQNGCEVIATIDAGNPDPLLASNFFVTSVSCFGGIDGSATADISGGEEPYTYTWSDGQSGQTATGLSSGEYFLTVEDSNGCLAVGISVSVTEPVSPLSVTLGGSNVTCWNGNDGSVLATATGGTPEYIFSWNNGAVDSLASELDAGAYTVTVTDVNGCLTIETLSLEQPESIIAQISTGPAICFGDTNGTISIDTAYGGNGPYVFSLDGNNFQTDTAFAGVPGGTYEITIQDVNGCEIVQQAVVTQPNELQVNLGADLVVELGDSIRIVPEVNSTDSMSYIWDPVTFLNCFDCPSPVVRPLDDISYVLTIIDETGCTASDEIFISVNKNRNVFIPNAFSPNDDGVNDIFMIYGGKGVSNIRSLVIFDRWGELVFQASNFSPGDTVFGWNGRLNGKGLNPAVFVFFAEVEFDDGVVIPYKGDVTLLK